MANSKQNSNEQNVDVLYQKLGEQWFAFSIVDEEVFMTSISEETLQEIRTEGYNPSPRNYEAT
ncbi:MAG: hypothetical protein H7333_08850 [Bdellovibrionales bacterium]|nr:hypothetical protein [Oligoflexia bacterium]